MELPKIGRSGSLLSILVPGTFLLLNIVIGFYFSFLIDDISPQDIQNFLKGSSGALSIIVFLLLVCIGYLLGVILRLIKCDITDNLSGWYLKHIEYRIYRCYYKCIRCCFLRRNNFHEKRNFKNTNKVRKNRISINFRNEKFPYIKWIGRQCDREYPEAKDFYNKTWGKKRDSSKKLITRRKSFLNLCKVIIRSKNETLANECYAAEALNRYISSMFYGIGLSFIIISFILIKYFFFYDENLFLIFLVIELIYAWSEWLIIRNYRFIRMKEVETVFAATYAIRESFGYQHKPKTIWHILTCPKS